MSKVIDFDAFRSEQKREVPYVKIGGKMYALPAALPVGIAVDSIRLSKSLEGGAEVPPHELDRIGKATFGEAMWEDLLLEHRLDVDEMGELFKRVIAVYTGNGESPLTEASTQQTPASSSSS